MVEQIEELEPHLEVKSLGDVRVLVNGRVGLNKGWVAELTRLLVPFRAARGRSELPCGEDPGEVSGARGGLLIAGRVWEIVVISIGVVITAG